MPSTSAWKRPFFLMWSGQAISILTSSIVQWAIIFYLTYTTQSGAVMSLATAAGMLPQALLGPIAGSLVDRLPRKYVMMGADSFVAAVTAVLVIAAYLDVLSVPLICVILFLRAIGSAFHGPAISASSPQLVPAVDLPKVAGYTSAIQNLGYIAGTVGAAIIYPFLPLWQVLALDIIGAAIAVLIMSRIYIPKDDTSYDELQRIGRAAVDAKPRKTHQGSIVKSIALDTKVSVRVMLKTPGVPELFIFSVLFMIGFSPLIALYPLMTLQYFGGTQFEASLVEMCFAGGMAVTGLLIGRYFSQADRGRMIIWSTLIAGVLTLWMGLMPPTRFWLYIYIILNFICGICEAMFNTPFVSLIQQRVPSAYHGRTFAMFSTIMCYCTVAGLAISGNLSDSIGVAGFFVISGAAIAILGIAGLFVKNIMNIESLPPYQEDEEDALLEKELAENN